jgi:hypothetical protein
MPSVPPIPVDLWGQIPSAAQAAILALVQQYEQRLQALKQQVDELRGRLNLNSTNSSRPPSSDLPHLKRRPPKQSSGRKRGRQPGHARQRRPLVPPEQIKAAIPLKPSACRKCGQALSGEDPQPRRHQGVEPTNNAAERALRHAVLWRKGSGGTDSSRGSRFVRASPECPGDMPTTEVWVLGVSRGVLPGPLGGQGCSLSVAEGGLPTWSSLNTGRSPGVRRSFRR